MVHGIRGACVLCNAQQYGWTLYLKTKPSIHRIVIVWGAISSKTKVMFRTRMCKQSLLIVSSCYIRVQAMMIAIEEFRFQERVESHIIWDAPALVTASSSGTKCEI